MKVYNYDEKTKFFTYESTAQISPLEKDTFLIPKNATTLIPLEKKDGFDICFDGKEWIYKEKPEPKEQEEQEKPDELTEYKAQLENAILNALILGNEQILTSLREEMTNLNAQILERNNNNV